MRENYLVWRRIAAQTDRDVIETVFAQATLYQAYWNIGRGVRFTIINDPNVRTMNAQGWRPFSLKPVFNTQGDPYSLTCHPVCVFGEY